MDMYNQLKKTEKLLRDYDNLHFKVDLIIHKYFDNNFKVDRIYYDEGFGTIEVLGFNEYRPTYTFPAECLYLPDDEVEEVILKHKKKVEEFDKLLNEAADLITKTEKLLKEMDNEDGEDEVIK